MCSDEVYVNCITKHESAKQMHRQGSQAQGNKFLNHKIPCNQSFQEDVPQRTNFRMSAA